MKKQWVMICGIRFCFDYQIIDGQIKPEKLMHQGENILKVFDGYKLLLLVELIKKWDYKKKKIIEVKI